MSRAVIIIHTDADRVRAAQWSRHAPQMTRIEFKQIKRSTEQNALMWAMLTDIAAQKEHNGRRYSADQWKAIFLHAIGKEISFLPSLDGATFIPWGNSSSDLSKAEMTALIDFMDAWCAQNGVKLHSPHEAVA